MNLLNLIQSRKARVGVVGLGYVGLPLARTIAQHGFGVTGFDIDQDRVAMIVAGDSPIRHIESGVIATLVESGAFAPTADFVRMKGMDVLIICVPTPLTRNLEPDLTYVESTARQISEHVHPGMLIVLESTTYPGTTTGVVRPILEASGLRSGKDFFLAYSPEREDPGNRAFDTATIPKVVSGDGADALTLVAAFYGKFCSQTVSVSTTETAEAAKLLENIFRAVNIALVNELKMVFTEMGIDVWEVIEAASTKPFGFMPFYPGPGLGGHCIPIDPFYLTWKAREYDITTRFIELAGEINRGMPRYVVSRLAEALDRKAGRGLAQARVLILGLAYKRNVDDLRESPSLKLIELIEARGASTEYHDPFIPLIPVTREHLPLAGRRSVALDANSLCRYDAVLIATDHDGVDYATVVRHARLVVDTRNACARAGLSGSNIVAS